MASRGRGRRGRGRRGRPRGTGQAPPTFDQLPVFDQQAFAEAVGVAAAAITQASIAGSQGGPSNLQRFRAHYPPTFTGGGDPDGGRPLVYADRECTGGYGDHLRYDQDHVSCIPARRRGPGMVEMG